MTIVVVKVAIVLAVIGVGAFYVKAANYVPFIPENAGKFGEFGISGIFRAAGIIFFAYIGFDAISTTSQEAKNPQKDMVWGIMGSLAICTVLYIAFSLVLVGMVNYQALKGDSAPTATAINMTPFPILKVLVKFGIVAGQTSVILVMLLASRACSAPCRRTGCCRNSSATSIPHGGRPGARTCCSWCSSACLRLHSDLDPGRDDLDRHPAGLRHRLHRRDGAAPDPSGSGKAVPHPWVPLIRLRASSSAWR